MSQNTRTMTTEMPALPSSLLYKSLRLSAFSGSALPACFAAMGVLLFLEMIAGVTYDTSWIGGLYLFVGILIVNMILYAWGSFGGRRLYNSEDWRRLERAAQEAAEAAGEEDIGRAGMSSGAKAAFAGGAAAAAGGRAVHAAGRLADRERARKAGDAASVAGGVVMAAAMFKSSRDERRHTLAMMDLLGVERRGLHTSRNLLLIETGLFVVLFIPAFFSLRADYLRTADVMQTACDELTGSLEATGLVYRAHSSVYRDNYAAVHAYLDEEGECYLILDIEKDGTISGVTYRLGIVGAEDDAGGAAGAANEALLQLYTALGETSAAETALYLWFEIDDEVAAYVSDGSYYRLEKDGVEITCNYGYDTYSECPYFYVWME